MSGEMDSLLERAALALERASERQDRGSGFEIPADLERRLLDLVAGDAMARAMIVLESKVAIPLDLEARLVDLSQGVAESTEPVRTTAAASPARRWRSSALALAFACGALLSGIVVALVASHRDRPVPIAENVEAKASPPPSVAGALPISAEPQVNPPPSANSGAAPPPAPPPPVQTSQPQRVAVLPPAHPSAEASAPPKEPLDADAVVKSLAGKVWSGRASVEEMRMLRAACKHLHDYSCRDRVDSLLRKANDNGGKGSPIVLPSALPGDPPVKPRVDPGF